MAPVVLCPDVIFAIIEHLTDPDDFLTWRQMCRAVEPQMTERLLATLNSPLRLQSVADIEVLHGMAFRRGSRKGGLAWFTGRVELAVGHVPETHLRLVLDVFELAHGITGMSVRDFDTTLSSFLVPRPAVDSDSATVTVSDRSPDDSGPGGEEKPEPSGDEVVVEYSDALARKLLACWARNPALAEFAIDYRRADPQAASPCEWRSDAILEKERLPFVTHLSVNLGGKPIGRWYAGWGAAFPSMTHLTLALAESSGANSEGGGWQAIQVETEPVHEDNEAERDLLGAEGEGEGREWEGEVAVQLDEGEHGGTGGDIERTQLEIDGSEIGAEETVERNDPGDWKQRLAMSHRVPRHGGRADH